MTLGTRPHEGRERNEHHTHQPDRLRTEHMLIVSPRPPVRSSLVGVLRDGGFSAEAVGDLAQARRRLSGGAAEAVMVVIDARPVHGAVGWSQAALTRLAREVPALLVIADAERRDALQEAVAVCPRGLLLDRLDLLSVLVCAEMLVDARMPPALLSDVAPAAVPPPPPVSASEVSPTPRPTGSSHRQGVDMARVAVLVADGFEDSELVIPLEKLREAGHEPVLIGSEAGRTVEGKQGQAKVTLDAAAGEVRVGDFDALLVPGGYSPDHLRLDRDVVEFARAFLESEKTVAVICHGPQLLIEADVVRGRTLTSWPSVRKDLENAGATWIDQPVVEDQNLISSRKPDDLEPFSQALLDRL